MDANRFVTLVCAIAFAACASSVALAQPIPQLTIIQPVPNETISGIFTFTLAASPVHRFATVDLTIGSLRIGRLTSSPYQTTWNTGYVPDGTYDVQAVWRNSKERILARTQTSIVINNHGNTLDVSAPGLASSLKGTITLTVRGSDSTYYPAVWQTLVDGAVDTLHYTDNTGTPSDTFTIPLDTTKYPNGDHELYIGMHSDFWPSGQIDNKSFYNWRAGASRVITFNNGHTLMGITANYLNLYLTPGGSATLICRRMYTDGTRGPCTAPTYISSDSNIMTVSPQGAVIAGSAEGFATVLLSDGARTTNVYVWVKRSRNVPHFAGNGQMLTRYDPSKSLFVVSPFVLSVPDLRPDSALLSMVQQSGVNTVSEGFYVNPRDINFSYADWQQYYDAYIAPDWQFAAANGLHILAIGDEVCRNIGGEAWWTLNWPYGEQAVKYAFEKLSASGVAVSVDMVDEASGLWGKTPKPVGLVGSSDSFNSISCTGSDCIISWPDNPLYTGWFPSSFALDGSQSTAIDTPGGQLFAATNLTSASFEFTPASPVTGDFTGTNDPQLELLWWAGNQGGCPSEPCDPPVPNDALTRITSWMHGVPNAVPISWPALSLSPPQVQGNWMGPNSVSDYASHYWTSYNARAAYAWTSGIQEDTYWMRAAFYQRQPFIMLDRPQLMEISISGPWYTKETSGTAYYTPPADQLDQPGVRGSVIISQMMTAAALGVAGERLYQFEHPYNVNSRRSAPIGSDLQTGANPTADDSIIQDNWRAMSYAATALTGVLAPYILGTELSSPAYGRNIVTAVRQSSDGKMLLIVNDNDWYRTMTVYFKPYGRGQGAFRYRITVDGVKRARPGRVLGETIRLGPGEAVAYVFPSHK